MVSGNNPLRGARLSNGMPVISPLRALTRTHALLTASDAIMAVALADSMFLSVDPGAARTKVMLFLALSMAPFAIVGPMIGPRIDRIKGGQRTVILAVALLRGVTMAGMAFNYDSLTLFPLAFAALVLSKTYAVSKSALVPLVVESENELVDANSKLGKTAGIVGFAAAVPAYILQFFGTGITLFLSALVCAWAFASALALPRDKKINLEPETDLQHRELHSIRVLRAAMMMRICRLSAGFMFFQLAFWLRKSDAGTAWFGFSVGVGALCTLAANWTAPRLRQHINVDTMLLAPVTAIALVGMYAGWAGSIVSGIVLTGVVNGSGAICRLAFEATIQREAPDANRANTLAKFETSNQLAWALAGLVPVVLSLSGSVGFATVGGVGVAGCVLFVTMSPGRKQRLNQG